MSKLALGTAQFGLNYGVTNKGGKVSEVELGKILDVAFKGGARTLDTAVTYGDAELRLGAHDLREFQIISKIPELKNMPELIAVGDLVDLSLSRLGVDSIHAVMLHRVSDLDGSDGDGIWEQMLEVKSRGLVQNIGYSLYRPAELDLYFERFPADIVQMPFNFLDRRFDAEGWLNVLSASDVEVHARSLFLQGILLAKQPLDLPAYFSPWLDSLSDLLAEIDYRFESRAAYCLANAITSPLIQKVVVGVESAIQLDEILSAELHALSDNLRWLPLGFEPDDKLINPVNWSC